MNKTREINPSRCRFCRAVKSHLSKAGWQQRYDQRKTGWDRGEPNPWMLRLLEKRQLNPCRILIPGCGRGHEAIVLAAAGFEVTAIDFAESAVEHLRSEFSQRRLSGNAIQTDLFSFCESNAFDAIYEQTCLCAIDPSQWQAYQQLLACWLRPGGTLFAMFMQSGQHHQPPFSCDIQAMRELFSQPDWSWLSEPTRVQHPSGMHEMACVLQRAQES